MKKDFLRKSGKAFAFYIFLAMAVFFPYIVQGQGFFTLANDYNYQEIVFNMYCADAIKQGNFLWDWNTDLGGSFVANYAYYTLGSPFFWLTCLFPTEWIPYVMAPVMMLKYAVAGLTAYWYVRRFVKRDITAAIGGLFYAFSGYQAANLLFSHFMDAVALFPLLLLGLEKLVEDKERVLFAVAVALNAANNYFFFIGEVAFLAIYYLFRFVLEKKAGWKETGLCLLEGLLGTGISMAVFLPGIVMTLGNPRVSSRFALKDMLFYSWEGYLRLFRAFLLPAEAMTFTSSIKTDDFSSCWIYLPMVGIFLVILYFFNARREKWLARLIGTLLVVAAVPVLNSIFYAFNSSYYARWFFMLSLLMALASCLVLEKEEVRLKRGMILVGILYIVFSAIIADGWIVSKERLLVQYLIAFGGIMLTVILLVSGRKNGKLYKRMLCAAGIFAVVTNSYVIYQLRALAPVPHATGAIKAWHEAASGLDLEDGSSDWRMIASNSKANLSLLMNQMSVSCWHSTVSGEIFRFYESLGTPRSILSPSFGLDAEAEKAYLSVKYEVLSDEDSGSWAGENEKKRLYQEYTTEPFLVAFYEGNFPDRERKEYTEQYTFYVYENENYIPMGFRYDSYITEEEYLALPEEERPYALLRALVVSEEEVQDRALDQYMRRISREELQYLDEEHMQEDIAARKENASDFFERDTTGFRSEVMCGEPGAVFYSVPYDASWHAEVNGREAEIIDTNGFMAVPVEEGRNEIVFTYQANLNKIGVGITGLSVIGLVIYGWRNWKKVLKNRKR